MKNEQKWIAIKLIIHNHDLSPQNHDGEATLIQKDTFSKEDVNKEIQLKEFPGKIFIIVDVDTRPNHLLKKFSGFCVIYLFDKEFEDSSRGKSGNIIHN